jgi:hypothetical protein
MMPTSVTLGKCRPFDHLRADQDVDLADAEVAQDAAVIILALQDIGVHAHDSRLRE